MDGYWSEVLQKRISRRRALATAGIAGAGAAFALACGGGSSSSGGSGTQEKSGLLAAKVDTSSKAVAGGIWATSRNSDVVSIDPNTNSSSTAIPEIVPIYSQLMKYGRGVGEKAPTTGDITGDAAESWELTPDGQQITLKLRQNHKFDQRPPTNGRAMTSADVKFSWDRTVASSSFIGAVLHDKSDSGPIESLTTPDDRTVVIKMAFPYAPIVEVLAYYQYLYIVPTEANGQFNPKTDARGSGPFTLDKWTPSAGFEFKRNPNWYGKDRPFLDGISRTVLPEYASGLAQFEAKHIWDYAVNQEDILRVKRDHPEMVMLQDQNLGTPHANYTAISQQPGSPMRDVRVRRAASMLLDREAIIDTIYNVQPFKDAGIPVTTFWNSHLGAQATTWLDPRKSELGEGAKYFKFDPAESKKMLSAASASSGKLTFWYHDHYGQKENEIIAQMLQANNEFNLDAKLVDYATTWRQVCQQSAGSGYNGFCYNTGDGYNDESFLVSKYTPTGKQAVSNQPLPKITDMVIRARTEIDTQKRTQMIKDIQKELAMEMLDIPEAGYALGFTLHWPWLKNYGVFTWGGNALLSSSSRPYTEYWYDQTLKT